MDFALAWRHAHVLRSPTLFWNLGGSDEDEEGEEGPGLPSIQGRYKEACDLISRAAKHADLASGHRGRIERQLQKVLVQAPYLELLYVTDATGLQVVNNVAPLGFQARYKGTGLGQDWSGRPWYLEAVKSKVAIISPVYKSLATGQLTVTISHAIRRGLMRYLGVLAADIGMKGMLR